MGILRAGNHPHLIMFRGPVLTVGVTKPVSDPAEVASVQPTVIQVPALLDTGAGRCVINPSLAAELGLETTGFGSMGSASHASVECRQYAVSIWLPPPIGHVFMLVPVLEAPRELEPFRMIVGRDIMAALRITFDFGVGQFTICS